MGWSIFKRKMAQSEEQQNGISRMTEGLVMPFSSLTLNIVSSSWECTQQIKPHLRPLQEVRQPREIYINALYICYLFRLLGLIAFKAGIERSTFLQVKEVLLSMVAWAHVQTFFGEPADKKQLQSLFYNTISDAEAKVKTSQTTYETDLKQIGFDLARDVLIFAGYQVGGGTELDEDGAAVLQLIIHQVTGIRNEGRLSELQENLVLARRAIDYCEKHGIQLIQLLKKVALQ